MPNAEEVVLESSGHLLGRFAKGLRLMSESVKRRRRSVLGRLRRRARRDKQLQWVKVLLEKHVAYTLRGAFWVMSQYNQKIIPSSVSMHNDYHRYCETRRMTTSTRKSRRWP